MLALRAQGELRGPEHDHVQDEPGRLPLTFVQVKCFRQRSAESPTNSHVRAEVVAEVDHRGEGLGVEFLGPGEDKVFGYGMPDLYDGQRMRPEKLEAWQALRERYGNHDESRVDRGTLLLPDAS